MNDVSLSELFAHQIWPPNETSARSWSWGAGLQNRVGIFRYSYWLLCNSFVKFADQNFSDALRRGPLEEIYLKKGVPRTKFQGNPLSLRTSLIRSKRAHSRKNEVGFLFCFQNFPNNSRYWMTTCQVDYTLINSKCRPLVETHRRPVESQVTRSENTMRVAMK